MLSQSAMPPVHSHNVVRGDRSPIRMIRGGRPHFSPGELRMPSVVAVLAAASTLIPLAVGYLNVPQGMVYSGFPVDATDNLSFLAAMREGAHGSWLWHEPYTTETQPQALIYFLYLALGHLQSLTSLPPVLIFHLTRLILGAVLVVAVYLFCGFFFSRRGPRRLAFLLAVFGGGVGALVGELHLGGLTVVGMDWGVAGSGVFPTLEAAPHYALASIAMLALFAVALSERGRRPAVSLCLAGLAAAVLMLIYPQVVILVVGTLLTLALWQRRLWPCLVAAAVMMPAGPFLAYIAYLRNADPAIAAFDRSLLPFHVGDPLGYLVVAHTIPALAFVLAVASRQIRWPRAAALPVTWIAWVGLLCFFPFHSIVLTRVFYIVSVPFGILGAWGLLGAARLLRNSALRRRAVSYGMLASALISVYSFAYVLNAPLRRLDPAASYVARDMHSALDHLGSQPKGAVMSTYVTGILIPPYAGQDTYTGSAQHTLDPSRKEREVVEFFASNGPVRARFMNSRGLRYVLFGPAESRLAADQGGQSFSDDPQFRLVEAAGRVEVYELRAPPG